MIFDLSGLDAGVRTCANLSFHSLIVDIGNCSFATETDVSICLRPNKTGTMLLSYRG